MTQEERIEIEKKIEELTAIKNQLKNEEQGIKLTMNSIYGATGNSYFICFNIDVATAVTMQGQDLIKYSEKVLHKYFHEYWHLDKELHDKLGLTTVKRVTQPLTIYGDTDSNYVRFQEVVNSCDWKGDPMDFVIKLNEYRLTDYLKQCFEVYAKKWGTDNYQDFELETLSKSGIFLGKKKYVTDLIYDSGVYFDSLSHLKITGVEMIKGGTPPFVREKLTYLTRYIFEKGIKEFNIREFVKELKNIKNDFKLQEPKNIAAAIKINNYDKFIINDMTALEVASKCPIHIRAAGYHNFLLNASKYKDKYPLIRSGEKVNYYYVNVKSAMENNVFAYAQGSYPYEFAPPIDYDLQFTKTILDPMNRFIEAMGYNQVSPNLFMINALF